MNRIRLVVVKNAAANVIRGGASSIVALALPHFLTRALSQDSYSAWVLMLQIAAYANVFDFGLQTAVARYVAQTIERHDDDYLSQVVSTAFSLMLAAAVIAIAAVGIVVWQVPHIFHKAPIGLIGELRWGALVLSAAAAINLVLSTFTGILVGLHRNELPALAIGSTRLVGAAAVLIAVHFTTSLIWLALCIGGFNVIGSLWQVSMTSRLLPALHISVRNRTRAITRELLHYCAGLTAFNFSTLLVGGLDITIVGYFSFSAAGYYGIAITVIGFVTGMSGAVYTALMAPMAVLQERGEMHRIRDLVLSTARLGSYVALLIVVGMILFGRPLLSLWVGPTYALQTLPILEILLWAQAIRLTASSYSIALVATGQQKYGIIGAIAEGVTNVFFSILGAKFMGPAGVAWGTMIGAICGVTCALFYTMRVAAKDVPIKAPTFTIEAILRPLLCFFPLCGYLVLHERLSIGKTWFAFAAMATAGLLVLFGRLPFWRHSHVEA